MTYSLPLAELLARIGLDRLPPPNAAGLFDLTQAFRQAIPFENLDPLTGQSVATDLETIFRKIVLQGRGGWCYELNQIFAEMLQHAGFAVKLRLARVGYRRPSLGPLTHLVLQVEADNRRWLLDVGFGGPGPTAPLLLVEGETVGDEGARFCLNHEAGGGISLQRWINGEWACLYEVAPIDVLPIDLEMASHFLSTWTRSPFRRQFMCIAHDGTWNWTIEGGELVRRNAQWTLVDRTPIKDKDHLQAVLESNFRIRVPMHLVEEAWKQADR
jgi:N-hydroxyarylamine O-acetyltransferase